MSPSRRSPVRSGSTIRPTSRGTSRSARGPRRPCFAGVPGHARRPYTVVTPPRESHGTDLSRSFMTPGWQRTGSSGARQPVRPTACRDSIRAEALFLPGIRVVVVPVALPEPGHVVVQELEAAEPLRALPEVALRNDEPHRPPVLGVERLAVKGVGEQHVLVVEH